MNSVVIGSGFGGIAAALRLKAKGHNVTLIEKHKDLGGRASCLLYTSPSPRDRFLSRMPSSA